MATSYRKRGRSTGAPCQSVHFYFIKKNDVLQDYAKSSPITPNKVYIFEFHAKFYSTYFNYMINLSGVYSQ